MRSAFIGSTVFCCHRRMQKNLFGSFSLCNQGLRSVSMQTTWIPHEKHGTLTTQSDLPDTVYAFPKQRKEPLTDARHVRNAVARFDQVTGVSDTDRALAFANIQKAAKYYNVDLSEASWRDLGVHPQGHRKEAAAKGVATKRERGELKDAAAKGAATREE